MLYNDFDDQLPKFCILRKFATGFEDWNRWILDYMDRTKV